MRFLLLAAALAACSGPKASSPTPTGATAATETPPAPGCPASAPANGSPCGRQLDTCQYKNEPRCPNAVCVDVASKLVWQIAFDHCPIACPPTKPAAGTSCSPVTYESCLYKVGQKCGFQMHCAATGWVEQELTLCDGM